MSQNPHTAMMKTVYRLTRRAGEGEGRDDEERKRMRRRARVEKRRREARRRNEGRRKKRREKVRRSRCNTIQDTLVHHSNLTGSGGRHDDKEHDSVTVDVPLLLLIGV